MLGPQGFLDTSMLVSAMQSARVWSQAQIGRVRKIAVEKGRPSTSLLITGRSQVPSCAGTSESDHSGVTPVEIHWSVT